jgi:hypothetical protein
MDSITEWNSDQSFRSLSHSVIYSDNLPAGKNHFEDFTEPPVNFLHDQIRIDLDEVDLEDFSGIEPIIQGNDQWPVLLNSRDEFDIDILSPDNSFDQKYPPNGLNLLSTSLIIEADNTHQCNNSVLTKRENIDSLLNAHITIKRIKTLPSIHNYISHGHPLSEIMRRYQSDVRDCIGEVESCRELKSRHLSHYEKHIILIIVTGCKITEGFEDYPGLIALSNHLSAKSHRLETMKKKVLINCQSHMSDQDRNSVAVYFPKFSQSGKPQSSLSDPRSNPSLHFKTLNRKFRSHVLKIGHAGIFNNAIRVLKCRYAELFAKEYELFINHLKNQHQFRMDERTDLDEGCDPVLLRLLRPRTLQAKIKHSKDETEGRLISKEFGVKIPWSVDDFHHACQTVSDFITGAN